MGPMAAGFCSRILWKNAFEIKGLFWYTIITTCGTQSVIPVASGGYTFFNAVKERAAFGVIPTSGAARIFEKER